MEFNHKPVLLEETIEGLNIKENGIYVDGTLGGAGHSKQILKKLSPKGLLIGIDRDEEALKAAKENLKEYQNVIGIFFEEEEVPFRVIDVPVATLPEADQKMLEEGIRVSDEKSLQRLLEDYES